MLKEYSYSAFLSSFLFDLFDLIWEEDILLMDGWMDGWTAYALWDGIWDMSSE